MKKLWGTRFSKGTDQHIEKLISSLPFDVRLARHDVEGSIAHAEMLGRTRTIPQADARRLVTGLKRVRTKLSRGARPGSGIEDVHTWIQVLLKKEVGQVADKLHTARSRNDQVVLDERLFVREEGRKIVKLIRTLERAILAVAVREKDTIIPAYTHLRRAQCVSLALHLAAYLEMLERDRSRVLDALERADELPLGACALSGTALPIDRPWVARRLKFKRVTNNSMDSVSDRDFIAEILGVFSILSMHLSRIADDLILWSGQEFGLARLDDSLLTGSSIMPHKKNPDPLEIVRGMTGRVYGNQLSLLVCLKGLPLTYHRDLQHDKEPLFDSVDAMKGALEISVKVFKTLRFDRQAAMRLTQDESLFSVDIVEYLIRKGISYRQAHDITGSLIRYCDDRGLAIRALPARVLKRFSPKLGVDVKTLLSPRASVRLKDSWGGTGDRAVRRQLAAWKKRCRLA